MTNSYRRTVTIGPLPIYFGNINEAMQLRGHHHTAQVWLHYGHRQGDHGYPSFLTTNNALRAELEAITGPRHTFRDATNEDVAERLFMHLATYVAEPWLQYGGRYWLERLDLDVEGVQDDIGHDNGTTRYTIALTGNTSRIILPHTDPTPNHQCSKGIPITHRPATNETLWACGAPYTDDHHRGHN